MNRSTKRARLSGVNSARRSRSRPIPHSLSHSVRRNFLANPNLLLRPLVKSRAVSRFAELMSPCIARPASCAFHGGTPCAPQSSVNLLNTAPSLPSSDRFLPLSQPLPCGRCRRWSTACEVEQASCWLFACRARSQLWTCRRLWGEAINIDTSHQADHLKASGRLRCLWEAEEGEGEGYKLSEERRWGRIAVWFSCSKVGNCFQLFEISMSIRCY